MAPLVRLQWAQSYMLAQSSTRVLSNVSRRFIKRKFFFRLMAWHWAQPTQAFLAQVRQFGGGRKGG